MEAIGPLSHTYTPQSGHVTREAPHTPLTTYASDSNLAMRWARSLGMAVVRTYSCTHA